jgi:hypothetical protein
MSVTVAVLADAQLVGAKECPVPEVTVSAASGTSLAGLKKSSVKSGTGQGDFSLVSLKELNCLLMFFCRRARAERPQVSAFARFRIDLPGIEAVLTGFQFSDHTRK